MGIESWCPNGHRVKVKNELAGRRGICPTCGERFRVPDLPGSPPVAVDRAAVPWTHLRARLPRALILAVDPAMARALPAARPLGEADDRTTVELARVGFPPDRPSPPRSEAEPAWFEALGPPEMPPENVPLENVPLTDWTPLPTTIHAPAAGRPRRRRTDATGIGISVMLLAAVMAAAAVAWVVLRRQGILP